MQAQRQEYPPYTTLKSSSDLGWSALGPDRVKTRTPGRQFTNFSRFSAFSAITGSAERKNSLQMRRFQTISEFSHRLDPLLPLRYLFNIGHIAAKFQPEYGAGHI